MALDSIYRIKETKKTEVKEVPDYKKMSQELKSMTASLMNGDLDQQWVKENESKENSFSTPKPKSEEEQQIDDVLAKFKRYREFNNDVRSQMRKQQLSSVKRFQETEQWVNDMTGGKSR